MNESPLKTRALWVLKVLIVSCALLLLAPLVATSLLALLVLARYGGRPPAEPMDMLSGFDARPVKTMSEIMNKLRDIPFESRLPRGVATLLTALLDTLPVLLGNLRFTSGAVYPYPLSFEPILVESADGTPVCGLFARQPGDGPHPALIFVHGLFGNKNTSGIQSIALKAYYDWGFHVFALDLRNFGDSSRFSEAPTSWGYRESEDVIAVAEYLDSIEEVTTVAACGISMGAASVILAAARSRLDRPLAGGVAAVSGYADAARTVTLLSSDAGRSPGSVASRLVFKLLLLYKTVTGGPRAFFDLSRYTREVAGQYYEIGEDDLYRRASPVLGASSIEVPCLLLHAADDDVLPVSETEELAAVTVNNPMVDSIITPRGGHALYPFTSNNWFTEVLKTFFIYWAEFGPGDRNRPGLGTLDKFGNQDG